MSDILGSVPRNPQSHCDKYLLYVAGLQNITGLLAAFVYVCVTLIKYNSPFLLWHNVLLSGKVNGNLNIEIFLLEMALRYVVVRDRMFTLSPVLLSYNENAYRNHLCKKDHKINVIMETGYTNATLR